MHNPLSETAERLRNDIIKAIKDARMATKPLLEEKLLSGEVVYTQNSTGDKEYHGDCLARFVSQLVLSLKLGEVCIHRYKQKCHG
jgi:hypothetical protein